MLSFFHAKGTPHHPPTSFPPRKHLTEMILSTAETTVTRVEAALRRAHQTLQRGADSLRLLKAQAQGEGGAAATATGPLLPRIHLESHSPDAVKLNHLMQCLSAVRAEEGTGTGLWGPRGKEPTTAEDGPPSFVPYVRTAPEHGHGGGGKEEEEEEEYALMQGRVARILDSPAWELLADCLRIASEIEPPSSTQGEAINAADLPGLSDGDEQGGKGGNTGKKEEEDEEEDEGDKERARSPPNPAMPSAPRCCGSSPYRVLLRHSMCTAAERPALAREGTAARVGGGHPRTGGVLRVHPLHRGHRGLFALHECREGGQRGQGQGQGRRGCHWHRGGPRSCLGR